MKTPICERRLSGVVMMLVFVLSAVSAAAAFELGILMPRAEKTSAAGHEVSGITVSTNDCPLPGVLIAISGNGVNLKGVSDAEGTFSFTSIPSGSYSIVFKMKGTKKVKREITVSTGDLDLGRITLG